MEKNRTQRIIDMAVDRAELGRKGIREQFKGMEIGTSAVSDAEFLAWFEMKTGRRPVPPGMDIEVSPPKPIDHPDIPKRQMVWRNRQGLEQIIMASLMISPWELALNFIAEGRETLDRYERANRKSMERDYGRTA